MKKTCMAVAVLLCSIGFLFYTPEAFAYGTQDVATLVIGQKTITVNERKFVMPVASYLTKRDNTMVPLRFLCENVLRATVDWQAATNRITLTSANTRLVIYLNTGIAQKADGARLSLPEKIVEKNGYTFVPLRLISEGLGCTVDFNAAKNKITLVSPSYEVVQPIADFSLPDTIVAGQTLTVQNLSYDPGGRKIVDQMWCVETGGETVFGGDLGSMLQTPKAGEHILKLKVKTADQTWSEWTVKTLAVETNRAPVIEQLTVNTANPKTGQLLEFGFVAANEDWETVTAYGWSYSFTEDGVERTVKEKPRAFFKAGTYTVTCLVQDAYGNVSAPFRKTISVGGNNRVSELAFKFSSPLPGERFLNFAKQDFNELPTVTPEAVRYDPVTLLASNNPEKVPGYGILYRDAAIGRVRLRYHHRNYTEGQIAIVATVKNIQDFPVTLQIGKKATAGPSADVLQVGQQVVASYLTSQNSQTVTLKPGQEYRLNAGVNPLNTDEISSALIDVSCDHELRYSVYAAPVGSGDFAALTALAKINTHIRGTFPNATINLSYVVDGKEEEKIILGREDAYPGYYLTGFDALSGQDVVNNGNRGVLHHITVKAERKVGVLLNPRGLIFQGVITGLDGKLCYISNGGVMTGSEEAVILGVLEAGQTVTLHYLAPSGSDSPILLVFVPVADW